LSAPSVLLRSGLLLGIAAGLMACQAAPPVQPARPVGADRDTHGCIGSAGYAWCPATQRCERPWELAAAAGFELTQENVARHCAAR